MFTQRHALSPVVRRASPIVIIGFTLPAFFVQDSTRIHEAAFMYMPPIPVKDQGCSQTCLNFVMSDLFEFFMLRKEGVHISFSPAWIASCKPRFKFFNSSHFSIVVHAVSHYPFPVWGTLDANAIARTETARYATFIESKGLKLNSSHSDLLAVTVPHYGYWKAAALLIETQRLDSLNDFPIDDTMCSIINDGRCFCGSYDGFPCLRTDYSLLPTNVSLKRQWFNVLGPIKGSLWDRSPSRCYEMSKNNNSNVTSENEAREGVVTKLKMYGSIAVHLCAESFHMYVGGIIRLDNPCFNGYQDHYMTLVGFNSEAVRPYWIFRNTWGQGWGENGYARVASDSKCGPSSLYSWAVDAMVPAPTPGRVELNKQASVAWSEIPGIY